MNLMDVWYLLPAFTVMLALLAYGVERLAIHWYERWKRRRWSKHREIYGAAFYFALPKPRDNYRRTERP